MSDDSTAVPSSAATKASAAPMLLTTVVSTSVDNDHMRSTVAWADLGIHIWGDKLFRGLEGRERGWGSAEVRGNCELGELGSAANSPSGVWGGAPAEIEFSAF